MGGPVRLDPGFDAVSIMWLLSTSIASSSSSTAGILSSEHQVDPVRGERAGLRGLNEGQKIAYEVVADKRTEDGGSPSSPSSRPRSRM